MGAPKTIIPADYQVDLDRLPAQPATGFTGLVMVFGVVISMLAGGFMLMTSRAAPAALPTAIATETQAATETPTLDSWDMTGTAIANATASPTVDYCFWLTPTNTPLPTVETVDSWGATGTAVYLATHPHQTATPTPDFPKAWCNNRPTATLTQERISTQSTETPAPTFTSAPTNTATSAGGNGYNPPVPPVPPGYTVLPTVDLIALPTAAPTITPTQNSDSGLTTRYG